MLSFKQRGRSVGTLTTLALLTVLIVSNRVKPKNILDCTSANDVPCVQELLKRGVDPNTTRVSGIHLYSSAHDYDLTEIDGLTPLMIATFRADPKMLKLLIQYGADPYRKDGDGRTALMWACIAEDRENVAFLSTFHYDINEKDHRQKTAIDLSYGNTEIISILNSVKQ